MAGPNPVAFFVPMLALGGFGSVLLGPFGGVMGVVVGMLLGAVANVTGTDEADGE
ncbi:hypothetical protein [Halorussus lipolyticus]|uniref:hypothetical protein n=1 Tax=Halorussus lipolyticus TaxID=3034024 RepID=UPI0023E80E3C|nr:hypothetical protein [Halorussus sp. DT80]